MNIENVIKNEAVSDIQYGNDLYEMYEKFKDDDHKTLVGSKNYLYIGFGHEVPLRPRVKAAFFMIDILQNYRG